MRTLKMIGCLFLACVMALSTLNYTAEAASNPYVGKLFINEVCASNGKGIKDKEGKFEDWLEFYNAGTKELSLKGLCLTDDPAKPMKWRFPDVKLKAKGYLIIWASEKSRLSTSTQLHTNFKIDQAGEDLLLIAADGKTTIDKFAKRVIARDKSFGRKPDGTAKWILFNTPTPGRANK